MTDRNLLISELNDGRARFLELVADVRAELHRYCARMTGSVADGEDIVQDTLARAYYILPELKELPPLRPWLFRIAQRRAIDHLRRYERRMVDSLDDGLDAVADDLDPEDALAGVQAAGLALSHFVDLPPKQRSCVVLKDVLGHSLQEIADLLELSIPAVKAALHRGRTSLRHIEDVESSPSAPSPAFVRYAALFNARDWDGVRAMLAEDVRLDLVTRAQWAGRDAVGGYLTRHEPHHDWFFVPAWLEGHEVIGVLRSAGGSEAYYYVELTMVDGLVRAIRDYRYVPYIAREARIRLI